LNLIAYPNYFLIKIAIILFFYKEVKNLYQYKKIYQNNTLWIKKVNININFRLLRKFINSILIPLLISKMFLIMGYIVLFLEDTNQNNKFLTSIPLFLAIFLPDFLFVNMKYFQQKSKFNILCLRKFDEKISNTTKWLIIPILEFYGKVNYVVDKHLPTIPLSNEYVDDSKPIPSDSFYDISSNIAPNMDFEIGQKWIFDDFKWKSGVTTLIKTTDICIIDITEFGEGVMWELAVSLTHKYNKIILVYDIGKLDISLNDLYLLLQKELKNYEELVDIRLLDNLLPPIPYQFYRRITDRIIFSYLIYKQINFLTSQIKI